MARGLSWRRPTVSAVVIVALVVAGAVPLAVRPVRNLRADSAPTELTDAVAAMAAAKRFGTRVEISGQRSETAQVYALPSGRLAAELHTSVKRVRRPDGTWTAPDATLRVAADGSVAPVAAAIGLRLSGGGAGPLVTVERAGRRLSLSWPAALPAPALDADTATYAEVLPGVDLRLRVEVEGFSEVLVVKSRQAGANLALRALRFRVDSTGLSPSVDPSGALSVVDDAGRIVFGSGSPVMWDSNASARRYAAMQVRVQSGEVVVIPDEALLADAATIYPVLIDPGLGASHWTQVIKNFPNQSNWTDANHDRAESKVGYSNDPQQQPAVTYRSLFEFPTEIFRGARVSVARFSAKLIHTYYCSASQVDLWRTGAIGPGTTWNTAVWRYRVAWNNGGDGNSCRSGYGGSSVELGTGGNETSGGLAAAAQDAADSGEALTVGLVSPDEGTANTYWKKFDPASPFLYVEFNHYPNVPDQLGIDAKPCVRGAGRPYVKGTPTLAARISDVDGGLMTGRFEWARLREDGTSLANPSGPLDQGSRGSGDTALRQIPDGVLANDDTPLGTGDWDGDGHPDVIARDAGGYLYLFPGDGRALGRRVTIGSGWNDYTIAGIADWDNDGRLDIVARADDGVLWLYPGDARRAPSTAARVQIGSAWNGYTFAGVVDWDRDRFVDIVASGSDGTLWLYPGEGRRAPSTAARVQIGSGWDGYQYFGTIDWDRDGSPDLLTQFNNDGDLWLYLGSGTRAPYSGSPQRFRIGTGWGHYTGLVTPDWNGDSAADLVARPPAGDGWLLYPGSGGRGPGGQQWEAAHVGATNGETYAFHAVAIDSAGLAGSTTGWCEFTVDTVAPGPPKSAWSDKYPEDRFNGGIGQSGQFTFYPPDTGADDVAQYVWALTPFSTPPTDGTRTVAASASDHTATVTLTPTSEGVNFLKVWTVDRAGNTSPLASALAYRFTVGPGTPAVAQWRFEEGGGTTAGDESGNGHQLSLTNVGWTTGRPGGALSFNGSNAFGSTPSVLDTSGSFSVAAWVRLTAGGATRAAVSQEGARGYAFHLGYSGNRDRWQFSVGDADAAVPAQASVFSDAAPQLGVWTHLVGVYDQGSRTIRLYVKGTQIAGDVAAPALPNATGALTIGRSRWSGSPADYWSGDVDEVQLWNRMLTASDDIRGMARPQPPVVTFPSGTAGTIGQPLPVTFAPGGDGDIVGYRYTVAGQAPTTVKATTPGSPVTVGVTPTAATVTFTAVTIDQAGNESIPGDPQTLSASPGPPVPHRARDLGGDGRADVTFGFASPTGGTQTWSLVSRGATFYPPTVRTTGGTDPVWDSAKLKQAGGDFDGDGRADVAYLRDEGACGISLSVARSDGNGLAVQSGPVWQRPAGAWCWGGSTPYAGDFTGDGRDDLLIFYDYGDTHYSLWVLPSTSTPAEIGFGDPIRWHDNPAGWADPKKIKIVVGDFNRDGRSDVGQFYDYGNAQTKLWMFYAAATGDAFTAPVVRWDSGVNNSNWADFKAVAGDVNGDGGTDIVHMYNYGNGVWRLWTFTLQADNTFAIAPAGQAASWSDWNAVKVMAGDFTGDGKADLAYFYDYGNGRSKLWSLPSTGTSFGPEVLQWDSGTGGCDWNAIRTT